MLDLLATIPQITVTQGTFEGQSTIVIDYSSPAPPAEYHERLIISSHTGVPIELLGGQAGKAPSTSSRYRISRVTVSAVENGSDARSPASRGLCSVTSACARGPNRRLRRLTPSEPRRPAAIP